MKTPISKKKLEKIYQLREKGLTYEQISKKVGVSMKAIYIRLNEKTKEEAKKRNERIIELRNQGMTHQEIADAVGCHRQTVGSVLAKQEGYVKGKAVDPRKRKTEKLNTNTEGANGEDK